MILPPSERHDNTFEDLEACHVPQPTAHSQLRVAHRRYFRQPWLHAYVALFLAQSGRPGPLQANQPPMKSCAPTLGGGARQSLRL
jgi:hypothetical protein